MAETVVDFPTKLFEPTDAQFLEACDGYARVLAAENKDEARLSREHLERLVRLARAGLAERQTRPA